jgi:hypothetical protein
VAFRLASAISLAPAGIRCFRVQAARRSTAWGLGHRRRLDQVAKAGLIKAWVGGTRSSQRVMAARSRYRSRTQFIAIRRIDGRIDFILARGKDFSIPPCSVVVTG